MSATPTGSAAEAPINLWNLGRVRVLQALTETPRLSRSDLVQRTGLARATVGSVVYDLIGAGLLAEVTDAATTGARTGRPPQLLSLRPDAAYAVGLDIGHDHVRAMLTDLLGTPLWDTTEALVTDEDPEQALSTAARLVDRAAADTGLRKDKILGVGLGIACPVEAGRGELHAENIMPGWVGVRPTDELAERTGLSVRIINDANACGSPRVSAPDWCATAGCCTAATVSPASSGMSPSSRSAPRAGAATAAAWRPWPARPRSSSCSVAADRIRSASPTWPGWYATATVARSG
jgi:hypothetical protein